VIDIDTIVDQETKSNYVIELFPIDGFVISLLLVTTPGLVALYLLGS
jgi:hypothetical protein